MGSEQNQNLNQLFFEKTFPNRKIWKKKIFNFLGSKKTQSVSKSFNSISSIATKRPGFILWNFDHIYEIFFLKKSMHKKWRFMQPLSRKFWDNTFFLIPVDFFRSETICKFFRNFFLKKNFFRSKKFFFLKIHLIFGLRTEPKFYYII